MADQIKNPFMLNFSLLDGKCPTKGATKRYLSNMRGMYLDEAALEEAIAHEDSLVYEFYEMDFPEDAGDLLFGTSIVYPGKVGNEYFMTKGHFHEVLETAEVYYCLKGEGVLMMENPEGEYDVEQFTPGDAVYVPKRYAHRTINTGKEPLVFFWVFRADAGHDYGTIETKGFRKLVVENEGNVEIVDNPSWK